MNDPELTSLLRELISLPNETEWVEFKSNYGKPQEIGEYLSALSNSACLHNKEKGYLVFGIENETHKVVGTRFKPAQKKIDTIGSGIKRMFQMQRKRNFPLPDYDLTNPARVVVRIQGKVLDENYTRLLIEHTDLDLVTVILLDKVQKRGNISKDEHRFLKSKKLVEGRYPNLFVSSKIASVTDEKSKYIKYRGLDEAHCQELVVSFIKQYGQDSRKDIDNLLIDKLPDVLSDKQKFNKINRLLSSTMPKKLKLIKNIGSRRSSVWVLTAEHRDDRTGLEKIK